MSTLLIRIVTLCALGFCGVAHAEIGYRGGDGTDVARAVVILGAPNTFAGIGAEGAWTSRQHPGWRKKAQALLSNNGRMYDVITYETADGPRKIWFDITDFFGKM